MKKILGLFMMALLVVMTACSSSGGGGGGGGTGTPTYTVTYDLNGGTGTAPVDSTAYSTGDLITIPAYNNEFTRSSYDFAGWTLDQAGNGTVYTQGMTLAIASADVTFYAKWTTSPTYNVTYNGNGSDGGTVPSDGTNYLANAQVTVLDSGSMTRAGYTFIGWNTDNSATTALYSPDQKFAITTNVSLYAIWTQDTTYTVTYDANFPLFSSTSGSVPIDDNAYLNGQQVTVKANTGNLTASGHRFSHWNTKDDGTGNDYYPNDPDTGVFNIGTANVTLYAVWVDTYSVTYDANGTILEPTSGDVPVDSNAYITNDVVTVLGNTASQPLTRTGYSFTGWSENSSAVTAQYTASSTFPMASSNVTLYAVWTELPTYTVTYHVCADDASYVTGNVPVDNSHYLQNTMVTVLGNTGSPALTWTGHTFVGWVVNADGTGTPYNSGETFQMGSSNVNLYAQWSTDPTYTVTYDGNGADNLNVPTDPNYYLANDTVTVLGNINGLAKAGYNFTGWNTNANGTGVSYAAGNTFTIINENVILYAQWTQSPTYRVYYNINGADGGSVPLDLTHYEVGAVVTVSDNTNSLSLTGYVFAGWNTAANGSGTTYLPGDTFNIGSADVTLYAQWATAYRIYYNGNGSTGGTAPVDPTYYLPGQNAVVLTKETLVKVSTPTSNFTGWNTQADGNGINYLPGDNYTMPAHNVTLYAKWTTATTYSVTYAAGGATSGTPPVDSTRYEDGASFIVLDKADLVRDGYYFTGWSDGYSTYTPGQVGVVDTLTNASTGTVTLTAQWTQNTTYSVTYNANGASTGSVPVDSTRYEAGASMTVSQNTGNLTKAGYSFRGWNTQADGNGTPYSAGVTYNMPAQNLTLYAKWLPGYTVTYNGNGATGGNTPADAIVYITGEKADVLGNTGSLVNGTGVFLGWTENSDGSGTVYTQGTQITIGSSNIVLYAKWSFTTVYTVTYDANNASSGTVPVDSSSYESGMIATALDNSGSLVRTGYTFTGWNTQSDGLGTRVAIGQQFAVNANITLYAAWSPVRAWYSIASSHDGHYLGAVVLAGSIWTSADYGATWSEYTAIVASNWYAITMSSDGTYMGAAVLQGNVYTSSNHGSTFAATGVAAQKYAGLADYYTTSNYIVALTNANSDKKNFYTGAFTGTLTSQNLGTRQPLYAVASSGNGSSIFAVSSKGGIWKSTGYAATGTWNQVNTVSRSYRGVACSDNGSVVAAVVTNGQIYVSTDGGASWTARASARAWRAVAVSSDGTKIAAAVNGGQIWISTDNGMTWTASGPTQAWYAITTWTDGSGHAEFGAAVYNGAIWISDYSSGVWNWSAR